MAFSPTEGVQQHPNMISFAMQYSDSCKVKKNYAEDVNTARKKDEELTHTCTLDVAFLLCIYVEALGYRHIMLIIICICNRNRNTTLYKNMYSICLSHPLGVIVIYATIFKYTAILWFWIKSLTLNHNLWLFNINWNRLYNLICQIIYQANINEF